jgi:hypothetical protein
MTICNGIVKRKLDSEAEMQIGVSSLQILAIFTLPLQLSSRMKLGKCINHVTLFSRIVVNQIGMRI